MMRPTVRSGWVRRSRRSRGAHPINTLTVWSFAEPGGAEAAVPRLRALATEGAVLVDDAAAISWPEGRRKPRTIVLGSLSGPGSLWGGFWGMLLGLIFLAPLAGATFGAAAGAVAGSLSDFGVEDDFVLRVRSAVKPGSSALFILSDAATRDRLAQDLAGASTVVVSAQLSSEQERRLRDALGEESAQPAG
jgi:uncharacterized membrane protein